MHKLKILGTGITIVAALSLAGCASENSEGIQLVTDNLTGITIPAVSAEPEMFMLALASGTLSVNPNGCLGITNEYGFTPVVWPYQTEFRDGTIKIKGDDPRSIKIGEDIAIGGGSIPPSVEMRKLLPSCFSEFHEIFFSHAH